MREGYKVRNIKKCKCWNSSLRRFSCYKGCGVFRVQTKNLTFLTYICFVFWYDSLLNKSPTGKLVEILAGVHRPVHLLQQARCFLLTALGLTNLVGCCCCFGCSGCCGSSCGPGLDRGCDHVAAGVTAVCGIARGFLLIQIMT